MDPAMMNGISINVQFKRYNSGGQGLIVSFMSDSVALIGLS